jgi:hypothetical protein
MCSMAMMTRFMAFEARLARTCAILYTLESY